MLKSHVNIVIWPIQTMIDYVRRRSLDRKLMANYLNLKKGTKRKPWIHH